MASSHVLLGITGGVAAYKAATLASRLAQAKVELTVVMTSAAQQFVGPATFSALSGRPVATNLFDSAYPLGAHIELARKADLLCVAPASADFLASCAQGRADDLLSTLYLAFTGPVFLAPAMNVEMWQHKAVKRNVQQLVEDGVKLIGPEQGWLSCRDQGSGRMSEPETILEEILKQLHGPSES